MEEQKPNFNWKRLLITTLFILLASAAVGGTTYYVLNSNFKKQNDANEKALNDIKNQLQEKNKKSTSEKPTAINQAVETTQKEVMPSYAADWYKFISPNYGFTFRYPKVGLDPNNPSNSKACGNPLGVKDSFDGNEYFRQTGFFASWIYGNFFGIAVKPAGTGAVSYIKSQDPQGYRSYHAITVAGAKEAYAIDQQLTKPYEAGYPPLSYEHYVLNDGKNLYVFLSFQAVPNFDECVPSTIDGTMDQIVGTVNFNK